jgi:signal transduction histidine kinase
MGGLSTMQSELITLIDSETSRLTDLTTRLLQMSRLDRVNIRMRPERIDVDEFFLALLSSAEISLSGRPINVYGLGMRFYRSPGSITKPLVPVSGFRSARKLRRYTKGGFG